jgi:hypothetical protein
VGDVVGDAVGDAVGDGVVLTSQRTQPLTACVSVQMYPTGASGDAV